MRDSFQTSAHESCTATRARHRRGYDETLRRQLASHPETAQDLLPFAIRLRAVRRARRQGVVVHGPSFPPHALGTVQEAKEANGATEGCCAALNSTHGLDRFWSSGRRCVYNTANRWAPPL